MQTTTNTFPPPLMSRVSHTLLWGAMYLSCMSTNVLGKGHQWWGSQKIVWVGFRRAHCDKAFWWKLWPSEKQSMCKSAYGADLQLLWKRKAFFLVTLRESLAATCVREFTIQKKSETRQKQCAKDRRLRPNDSLLGKTRGPDGAAFSVTSHSCQVRGISASWHVSNPGYLKSSPAASPSLISPDTSHRADRESL